MKKFKKNAFFLKFLLKLLKELPLTTVRERFYLKFRVPKSKVKITINKLTERKEVYYGFIRKN